ncbi:MAG: LPS export ABC transporter ATP-binding protein [Actinomycetota bacterium]|nr:LPS export ABC transporter ATP-binding protein [Actinomycetota bacterium]
MSGGQHVLRASGLTKKYGRKTVVSGLNVEVRSGDIIGLLGPNGAGKTTSFYMIAGLLRPDSGRVELDQADITGLPMYQRARMGISYLPQEPSIFRKLSVSENLQAVLEITGRSGTELEEMTARLLDEFNLKEFASREGFRLSGGERRRAEIARSLATEPRFILFDEPFTGIDPIAIIELKKMLKYLKGKGLGILITDHNVRDTLSITDRAYIISGGKVLFEGAPEQLVSEKTVRETYLGQDFRL